MSEQEPEPTGDISFDGVLFTGDEETAEIHGERVFIPKAWRKELGFDDVG